MYHPHIWELQPKSWKCSSHELVIVAVGNITARHIGKDSLVVGFFRFKLPGAKMSNCSRGFSNTEKKGTCRRPTEAKSHLCHVWWFLIIFWWFSDDFWVTCCQRTVSVHPVLLFFKKGNGAGGTPSEPQGGATQIISNHANLSSWWFQPLWKILVKMGIFPK